jgi:hypothetical protein
MRRCFGKPVLWICLALATGLPAGCGDSAPSGTPNPSPPTPQPAEAAAPKARETGKRGKKAAKLPTFRDYFQKKKQSQSAGGDAAP